MTDPKQAWEERLREAGEQIRGAGEQIEDELRRAVRYLDEEVVPEVRRGGSAALRTVADRLRVLAERLDDAHRRGGGA